MDQLILNGFAGVFSISAGLRCFSKVLFPLAKSCNAAIKLPLFIVSSEKPTLSSPQCPRNGNISFVLLKTLYLETLPIKTDSHVIL